MRWRLVAFLLALAVSVHAQPSPIYRVIVNPKNNATTVERKFVEDAFLKKVSQWPNGETIKPVDLTSSAPVRRIFSNSVLGRSIDEVRRYWQQRIFAGRDVPPPELATDGDVIKYVLSHEGAIGYVSAENNIGEAHVVVVR